MKWRTANNRRRAKRVQASPHWRAAFIESGIKAPKQVRRGGVPWWEWRK